MAARKAGPKAQSVGHPLRGDVFLVNFDPTIGSEIRKIRPALVIQNDIANRYSPITIVAAITSKCTQPPYPTEVIMSSYEGGLSQTSAVLLNQIRSIDRHRLVKKLGHAGPQTMERVDQAIQISLGLLDL
jgi:mRNA interferase MazF